MDLLIHSLATTYHYGAHPENPLTEYGRECRKAFRVGNPLIIPHYGNQFKMGSKSYCAHGLPQ